MNVGIFRSPISYMPLFLLRQLKKLSLSSDDVTEHFETRVRGTSERVSCGMTNPIAHDTIKQHNYSDSGEKSGGVKNYGQYVLHNSAFLFMAQGGCGCNCPGS